MAKRTFINQPPSASGPRKGAPKDAVKVEFARRLQAALLLKGWRQSDLAREAAKHLPRGTKLGRDSISHYIRARILPRAVYLDALCKALGTTKEELIPTEGYREAGDTNPPLDVRDMGNGNLWLRINRAVRFAAGAKILQILAEEDAAASGGGGSEEVSKRNGDGDSGSHMAVPA